MPKNVPPAPSHSGTKPPLSVVMPVHNAMPHLDRAIDSILGQTFEDFELVILDDGSTDGSTMRLHEWSGRDARIRLLSSKVNLGPVGSSNMVANAAKADFVARMDGDDISYPERLAEQLKLLRSDASIGVVGSLCDAIDGSGAVIRPPESWRLSRRSPFVPFPHGAMMYRRGIFEEIGGYRPQCVYWEDQDLIVRMAAVSRVVVIPRALYQVRLWNRSTRVASDADQLERSVDRMYAATDRLRHKRHYDDLLVDTKNARNRVDPRVFIALGSVNLWGGGRPRLLHRLIRRGQLGLNPQTFSGLVWTVWASISPSSLRTFLKFLLWARDQAAHPLPKDEPVDWHPFGDGDAPKLPLKRSG
jgi:glycosyltransferase involved in cell wall biosynthesis